MVRPADKPRCNLFGSHKSCDLDEKVVQHKIVESGPLCTSIRRAGGTASVKEIKSKQLVAGMIAEYVKNQFEARGDTQLVKNPVEIISHRMLRNTKFLPDFAIFQPVSH